MHWNCSPWAWRNGIYGEIAESTKDCVLVLGRALFSLRRRSPGLKRLADFLRAGLFQFFMRRKLTCRESGSADVLMRSTDANADARLTRLIEWLQATGEFEQEWQRVDNWRSYWSQLPSTESEHWLAVSAELFDWFTGAADEALGKYTVGRDSFPGQHVCQSVLA